MTNQEKIDILESQILSPTLVGFTKIQKLYLLQQLYGLENHNRQYDICQMLITEITKSMNVYKDDQIRTAHEYIREAYTILARVNFHAFLIAMEWNRRPEDKFYQPRAKILNKFGVIDSLQMLGDGELDLMVLNMPPRTGKSTIGLFYMTWCAGRNKLGSILGGGYSTALVKSFHTGCHEFITSDEYRFVDIFPNFKLHTSAEYLTLDIGDNGRYKTMTFRSIDGTVTGATEANELLYLDDVCSGIEEAMNLNRLATLWNKITIDLLQRRVTNRRTKRTAPILAIGTLWSIHDPISKLTQLNEDNPRTRVVKIPALDDEGHSNFMYDGDVGFNDEYYLEMKNTIDEVSFSCVYQQKPMERDGILFPASELKRYSTLPNQEPDSVIAFCDVAFGGKDFLSHPIAYQYGEDVYIVDAVFMTGDYKVTEPIVTGKILEHKIQQDVFEANNGGDFYSRDIASMVKDKGHKINITSQRASNQTSKLTRIIQHAPAIKTFWFRDETLYTPKSDYGKFMENLTTFLQTGKSQHDDAPDSLAGLASIIRTPQSARVSTGSRQRTF